MAMCKAAGLVGCHVHTVSRKHWGANALGAAVPLAAR